MSVLLFLYLLRLFSFSASLLLVSIILSIFLAVLALVHVLLSVSYSVSHALSLLHNHDRDIERECGKFGVVRKIEVFDVRFPAGLRDLSLPTAAEPFCINILCSF